MHYMPAAHATPKHNMILFAFDQLVPKTLRFLGASGSYAYFGLMQLTLLAKDRGRVSIAAWEARADAQCMHYACTPGAVLYVS